MVLGLEITSLYLSCGLCHSIRPQSTGKRVVNKKCGFYGKRNFNLIYRAILHIDQCCFGTPRWFDMVLGLEMTSFYLSCGLCHSISPQPTRKRVVNTCKVSENVIFTLFMVPFFTMINVVLDPHDSLTWFLDWK